MIRLTKRTGAETAILNVTIEAQIQSARGSREISHDIPCFVLAKSKWDELRFDPERFKPHGKVRVNVMRHLRVKIARAKGLGKGVQLRITRKPTTDGRSFATHSFVGQGDTVTEGILEVISKKMQRAVTRTVFTRLSWDYEGLLPFTVDGQEAEDPAVYSVTVDAKLLSAFLESFSGSNANLRLGIRDEFFTNFKIVHNAFTATFILPRYDPDGIHF
jgi:hypothetical protein